MNTGESGPIWHAEGIEPSTRGTLTLLKDLNVLSARYLAGGTGLALHFGHRLSVDLDFFDQILFDADSLVASLAKAPDFSVVSLAPHTVHATIRDTKVSFLGYAYPVLFPFADFEGVDVADPREIACMKVAAIASRGTKRDFVDLFIAVRAFGLAEVLNWFGRKYRTAGYSRIHILKSLTFFEDAEKDPMPHLLRPLDWSEVTRFFRTEVPRLR